MNASTDHPNQTTPSTGTQPVQALAKIATHVTNAPTYVFLGVPMTIHLSGAQTGGEFSLIEAVMPPGGDGGLHMHTQEDETLYLLEGELSATIGDKKFSLKSGESYFAPRNIPHRLINRGSIPARALLINTPGTFDEFVRQAGVPATEQAAPPSGPPTPEQIQHILTLAETFGVKVLAPPGSPE
jgi:mannose-6-phosphate isomerase-like protein (cupin superfamily)